MTFEDKCLIHPRRKEREWISPTPYVVDPHEWIVRETPHVVPAPTDWKPDVMHAEPPRSPRQRIAGMLEAEIAESWSIAGLGDDWDGEGSRGYSADTINRAAELLRAIFKQLPSRHASRIGLPEILVGPDGSIDLHWETASFELLLNVPSDSEGSVRYYGDDYGSTVIKGPLEKSRPNKVILSWLLDRAEQNVPD